MGRAQRTRDPFVDIMGTKRGSDRPDEEEDAPTPSGPLSDWRVTAQVSDAAQFQEKMEVLTGDEVAPGFELCKAPTEEDIEFYLKATSEADVMKQFQDACNYVGQTASDIEIESS